MKSIRCVVMLLVSIVPGIVVAALGPDTGSQKDAVTTTKPQSVTPQQGDQVATGDTKQAAESPTTNDTSSPSASAPEDTSPPASPSDQQADTVASPTPATQDAPDKDAAPVQEQTAAAQDAPTPAATDDATQQAPPAADTVPAQTAVSTPASPATPTPSPQPSPPTKPAPAPKTFAEQTAPFNAEEGIDNLDIEEGGNWVLKRQFVERARPEYKKVRELYQKVDGTKEAFFEKRNQLDADLDAFYEEIGFSQGELEQRLNELLQDIEHERQQEGALSAGERNVLSEAQEKKNALEQLKLDVKSIRDVDTQLDQALVQLLDQIGKCFSYEQKAWDQYQALEKVLNDKKAKEFFYRIDGYLKNMRQIDGYISGAFSRYFDDAIAKARSQMTVVKQTVNTLTAKGVELKKKLAAMEQEDEKEDAEHTTQKHTAWYDSIAFLWEYPLQKLTELWHWLTGASSVAQPRTEQTTEKDSAPAQSEENAAPSLQDQQEESAPPVSDEKEEKGWWHSLSVLGQKVIDEVVGLWHATTGWIASWFAEDEQPTQEVTQPQTPTDTVATETPQPADSAQQAREATVPKAVKPAPIPPAPHVSDMPVPPQTPPVSGSSQPGTASSKSAATVPVVQDASDVTAPKTALPGGTENATQAQPPTTSPVETAQGATPASPQTAGATQAPLPATEATPPKTVSAVESPGVATTDKAGSAGTPPQGESVGATTSAPSQEQVDALKKGLSDMSPPVPQSVPATVKG